MSYITVAELRTFAGIEDSIDDETILWAVDAATGWIDRHTGRNFTVPTGVTIETFRASDPRTLTTPFDLADTTGLIVETDDNDDGTYETTWTETTDFVVGAPADTGWPTSKLYAVGSKWWPVNTRRPAVRVTGNMGWAATPEPVRYATLLLARDLWKQKDAPFGVAGFGEFGPLRVRADQTVLSLLAGYRTGGISIGIGGADPLVRLW